MLLVECPGDSSVQRLRRIGEADVGELKLSGHTCPAGASGSRCSNVEVDDGVVPGFGARRIRRSRRCCRQRRRRRRPRGGEEMDRRVLTPRQRGGFDSCAVVGQGYAGDQESHGLRSQPPPFCDAGVEFPGLVAEPDAVDVEGAALEGAHGDVEGSRVPVS